MKLMWVVVALPLMLAACNTVNGFGQDLSAAATWAAGTKPVTATAPATATAGSSVAPPSQATTPPQAPGPK